LPEVTCIFAAKKTNMLNTVIFDMDGLLIDSEPLWQKAGMDTLEHFGAKITIDQYHTSTGLRTKEWIEYWFNIYQVDPANSATAISMVLDKAIEYIDLEGQAFPGTYSILNYFKEKKFRIGLATSSPLRLVDVVVKKLGIGQFFKAYASAEFLPLGKPHPQVYLNCAEQLGANPINCLGFEDSFYGMISVKAAKMKCVVIPEPIVYNQAKWTAADFKLLSLKQFDDSILHYLSTL
jgi:sugar-phosphatase